jgi:hypothetical protein
MTDKKLTYFPNKSTYITYYCHFYSEKGDSMFIPNIGSLLIIHGVELEGLESKKPVSFHI